MCVYDDFRSFKTRLVPASFNVQDVFEFQSHLKLTWPYSCYYYLDREFIQCIWEGRSYRVSTDLENLEKSWNLPEKSGKCHKFPKVREMSGNFVAQNSILKIRGSQFRKCSRGACPHIPHKWSRAHSRAKSYSSKVKEFRPFWRVETL